MITKYDLLFLGLIILFGMYFYQIGIIRIIKPFLGIFVAKITNGMISNMLIQGGVGSAVQNAIDEILSKQLMYKNPQLSADISDTFIKVGSFILTFFIAKVLINIIYSTIRPKIQVLRKADHIIGMLAGIVMITWITKIVVMAFNGMSQLQFVFAENFMNVVNNSFLLRTVAYFEWNNIFN